MKSMRMAYMAAAAGALSLCALSSCDVHEFPAEEPESHSVVLNLDFRTALPLYQTIEYTRSGKASAMPADYDIRYQIRVYKTDNEGEIASEDYTALTVTKDDVTDPDHRVSMEIGEGSYRFLVWADYVDNGGDADKFYTTGDFKEITLAGDGHCGNNAFRDAFRGETVAAVTAENGVTQEITVEMERPLARFQFVTTDLETFITNALKEQEARNSAEKGNSPTKAVNLDDYRIVFRYAGFMPSAFNNFTNKPIDAVTGVSFTGRITRLSETEAELGFDYVFVNGTESTVPIAVEVYNMENELLSSTDPIDVPLERSKLTIVRGPFLTTQASGGVGIDPGFDGEWNYEIR